MSIEVQVTFEVHKFSTSDAKHNVRNVLAYIPGFGLEEALGLLDLEQVTVS